MMKHTRYPEQDFTLFVSKGNTSIDEWLAVEKSYRSEGLTRLELYDLRLHTNLFSNDEIEMILSESVNHHHRRPPDAKTAVIVLEAAQFGLSRMYELKAEVEGIESPTGIYYGLTEALEWLGDEVKDLLKNYE